MASWGEKARAIAAILRGEVPVATAPVMQPVPVQQEQSSYQTPQGVLPGTETLIGAQRRLIGAGVPAVVLDVGAHHGHSTVQYLEYFSNCRAFAFEADAQNFAAAQCLLAGRAELMNYAVSDRVGTASLHVNSHDGTHSLYEIGAQRYWGGFAEAVTTVEVPTTTLDAFCSARGLDTVDILKMDIQGGELKALKGAAGLLSRQAIRVIALEVEFQLLYKEQPLFWDIGAYLSTHGYGLYRLFDCQYHLRNDKVLSWADAIFLDPSFLKVTEWERDT